MLWSELAVAETGTGELYVPPLAGEHRCTVYSAPAEHVPPPPLLPLTLIFTVPLIPRPVESHAFTVTRCVPADIATEAWNDAPLPPVALLTPSTYTFQATIG